MAARCRCGHAVAEVGDRWCPRCDCLDHRPVDVPESGPIDLEREPALFDDTEVSR